ncbi:hypothetical protein [Massilia sp. HP4]|uniref:hypothetical protein n=1 Tax=Massilia sp. HP4 TaxID=2562316 RepID=UPI001484F846|nr:hypothetical protein [Massilia sp. HP4]
MIRSAVQGLGPAQAAGRFADPGLFLGDPANADAALIAFKTALAGHRVFARETDPRSI